MPWFGRKPPGSNPFTYDPTRAPSPAPAPTPSRIDGGARFRIDGVYTITGIGTVVVGEAVSGFFRTGQTVRLEPGPGSSTLARETVIRRIESRHLEVPLLSPGPKAGIALRGVTKRDVARGDLLTA